MQGSLTGTIDEQAQQIRGLQTHVAELASAHARSQRGQAAVHGVDETMAVILDRLAAARVVQSGDGEAVAQWAAAEQAYQASLAGCLAVLQQFASGEYEAGSAPEALTRAVQSATAVLPPSASATAPHLSHASDPVMPVPSLSQRPLPPPPDSSSLGSMAYTYLLRPLLGGLPWSWAALLGVQGAAEAVASSTSNAKQSARVTPV